MQSTNRQIPSSRIQIAAAGKKNFFDIDNKTEWTKVDGKSERSDSYTFNPENYTEMADAMKKGKTIVVAAEPPHFMTESSYKTRICSGVPCASEWRTGSVACCA